MKLRIIAAVLLVVVVIAAFGGAWLLQGELSKAREQNDVQALQLQELTEQANQLQTILDGLTLDKAQTQQSQAEELTRQAMDLEAQIQALGTEMDALNAFLEENQEAAAQLQEELTYLQGVYDALEEGLEQVKSYIAGN